MISHGLISAALFLSVGVLYDRTHSRMINSYGGIVNILPKFSLIFMIFTLSALGIPGTSGFIGEFLVLIGIFQKNYFVAILATLGVILAAAYMLWLYKRVIFGNIKSNTIKEIKDINISEGLVLSLLAIATIVFGFYPEPILDTISVSSDYLIENYKKDLAYHLMVKK